jgi:hypothetical protein
VDWYYIGVHGYGEEAKFSLTVGEDTGGGEAAKGAVATTDSSEDPNAKMCDNCHSYMPASRLTMHSMSCARQNWRCGVCAKVMRKALQATHAHCGVCGLAMHKDDLAKHEVRQTLSCMRARTHTHTHTHTYTHTYTQTHTHTHTHIGYDAPQDQVRVRDGPGG